jgi:hypothetical protein
MTPHSSNFQKGACRQLWRYVSFENDVFIAMPFELLVSVNVLGQMVGSSWLATYCLSMTVMLLHVHIHAALMYDTVALIS